MASWSQREALMRCSDYLPYLYVAGDRVDERLLTDQGHPW
jgi:hypothetical protein